MKAEQLQLVLESLTLVQPLADSIAKSFYLHLFELVPQAQKLFTSNMERQGTMLMTSLSLAVTGLSDMETILPAVQALGERHFSYGVKPEYFQSGSYPSFGHWSNTSAIILRRSLSPLGWMRSSP